MPTLRVKEFTGGLDARRLPETTPGAALILGRDIHLNRGGEIEQRADFVVYHTLPADSCVGLAATRDQLFVFGSGATAPVGLPSNVVYQRLQHPDGVTTLTAITHWTKFKGQIVAIGEFADGARHLFVNGARVTDSNAPPNRAGSANPTALLTYGAKLYVGAGPLLFFSAVDDASDFTGTGAGFIDMSTYAEGAENIVGLARYSDRVAVFAEESIQLWYLDVDPTNNRDDQILANTGVVAPGALVGFGDGDIAYLDQSGIRSLRARDSSTNAITTDIGSPIDPLVSPIVDSLPAATRGRVQSVVEPRDARYMLSVDSTIYVFSFFPAPKISAWTTYRLPGAVDSMLLFDRRIYLRVGDTICAYGGVTGPYSYGSSDPGLTYLGTAESEVWLAYLDAERPAQAKHVTGFDAAARGSWGVYMGLDPENLTAFDTLGVITGGTFTKERHPAQGSANHISLRFRCLAPAGATAPAVLSSVLLHYDLDEDEDSA